MRRPSVLNALGPGRGPSWNQGWSRASSAVMRFMGSYSSIRCRRGGGHNNRVCVLGRWVGECRGGGGGGGRTTAGCVYVCVDTADAVNKS